MIGMQQFKRDILATVLLKLRREEIMVVP